jgi:uncharacterized protein YggE
MTAMPAAAQETEKLPPHIRTSGDAVVTVQPDRALIDIGVVTQSDTSKAAVTGNAEKAQRTITALRQLLGSSADIKTISYTLAPVYRYPKEGGEPTITGYIASNIVRVTLDDLTKVGNVIDTGSQAGANQIQNLRFTMKDDSAVQAEALRNAALKARAKAQALASAMNVRILRVRTLEESSSPVYPVRDIAFMKAEAASTPIEAGTIEIRASVVLTVDIAQ